MAKALALVSRSGTVITFGNSSGLPVSFDENEIARGARMLSYSLIDDTAPPALSSDLSLLLGLIARGSLRCNLDLVVDWRGLSSAIAALLSRQVKGKAVATIPVA